MAYHLHIERGKENPVALSEWRAAIDGTQDVRLFAAAAHTITNPETKEVISVNSREGDAEVFFPESGRWHSVFRWYGHSIEFAVRFPTTETSHPVWQAAVALATRLSAVIRGDEGEGYDLQTGKVVGV